MQELKLYAKLTVSIQKNSAFGGAHHPLSTLTESPLNLNSIYVVACQPSCGTVVDLQQLVDVGGPVTSTLLVT